MFIELRSVYKTYDNGKQPPVEALKDINLKLPKTGMIFVLGKSGCGKSTLLNLLGGLDKSTDGGIYVDNQKLEKLNDKHLAAYRNTYVGFVFQENNLFNDYSVLYNVELPLIMKKQKDSKELALKSLAEVDIASLAEKKPNFLSGGQKQRTAIARAIVKNPKILLCDEPTGALDQVTGKSIFELLKQISSKRLVVIASHDREAAYEYGDRIIEISDGQIIADHSKIESKDLTDEKFEVKTSKLPFKDSLFMGIKLFKTRVLRLIMASIATIICFSAIGCFTTYIFNDLNDNIFTSLQNNDVSALFYKPVGGVGQEYSSYSRSTDFDFPDGISENYANEYDYTFLVNNFSKNNMRVDRLYTIRIDSSDYYDFSGYIEVDDTFLDDYGYDLVSGKLPVADDEIAISKYIADYYIDTGHRLNQTKVTNYQDIIFKENNFIDIFGKKLKITGIIDTKFNYEFYEPLENDTAGYFEKPIYESARANETIYGLHNAVFLGKDVFKMVYLPTEVSQFDYQIKIDTLNPIQMRNLYLDGSYEYFANTLNKENAIYYNDSMINRREGIILFIPTYSQEYTQLENSIENINMHGIDFASQSDVIDCYNTNMSVYSYEQMLQNLQLNLECDIAAIFPSNNCDMEDFSAILNENLLDQVKEFANTKCWKNNFLNTILVSPFKNKLQVNIQDSIYEPDEFMRKRLVIYNYQAKECRNVFRTDEIYGMQWKGPLFYVSIAALIVGTIMIVYHLSGIVREKKKDIGLMRCLGMKQSNICKIFILNSAVFFIGVAVISSIISSIFPIILNAAYINNIVDLKCVAYQYNIFSFLTTTAIIFVSMAIGLLIPLSKVGRIKADDVLNERK